MLAKYHTNRPTAESANALRAASITTNGQKYLQNWWDNLAGWPKWLRDMLREQREFNEADELSRFAAGGGGGGSGGASSASVSATPLPPTPQKK